MPGPGVYEQADLRFILEIPSEHPTIREPLTVEIPDPEPGGPIDVYWGGYFEHVFLSQTMPTEQAVPDQFARVIQTVEEWMDEAKVFALWHDEASGRRVGWGRLEFPLPKDVRARALERHQRIVYTTWRGSHAGEWPPNPRTTA